MKPLCHGFKVTNPTDTNTSERNTDSYVDDATTWTSAFFEPEVTPEELALRLQHDAQTWEQLLHVTGGKLAWNKCGFYLIAWKWDNEGTASIRSPADLDLSISLADTQDGTAHVFHPRNC